MNQEWIAQDQFEYACSMLSKFNTKHNVKNEPERIVFWCEFVKKCYDEMQLKETK